MTIADGLMILAVFSAPFFAVWAQTKINNKKDKRNKQHDIFKTLMATRAAQLSRDHVKALNSIDIEFDGKDRKSKDVRDAWKVYCDHLHPSEIDNINVSTWNDKKIDLLIDLLHKMAVKLRYEFDKVHLRKTAYSPMLHTNIDQTIVKILEKASNCFEGKDFIHVATAILDDGTNINFEELEKEKG